MKFGIVVNRGNRKSSDLFTKIRKYLLQKGQEVLVGNLKKSDIVIVLGGDGLLLHTACENVDLGIPFIGINVGRLGFLTAAETSDWKKALSNLVLGKYIVSERMTIEASVEPKSQPVLDRVETRSGRVKESKFFRALNEIVVKGAYRVCDLEIAVGGQKFLTISGDGVIVATQTGSTAYSLSAGGPIVDPALDSLLVTPINAHGLPIPSMVFSPLDAVEVKIKEGNEVSLIIDGQEHVGVSKGQRVRVLRGKHRVKFIYFDKQHFLRSLNAKFGLGR